MRGYGLPRTLDLEFPDVADIQTYGLKSCVGSIRGKGGDHRGIQKSKRKKASRRIFKKSARTQMKRNIRNEISSI
jgi:hypothetical protein